MNHTFVSLVPNSDDEEYQSNKTRMNAAPGTRAKRECARKIKKVFGEKEEASDWWDALTQEQKLVSFKVGKSLMRDLEFP